MKSKSTGAIMAVIRVLSILAFLPIVVVAQLAHPEVRTETDLAEALYRSNSDAHSTENLLSAHQQLFNDRLWTYLNGLARAAYFNQSPKQSIETYQAALLVAGRLQDSKLLARSYYNIGIAYSGLNQYPKAIASYEKSREYFEQEGLQRDLIYVLADLGALYFIVEDYDKARDRSYESIVSADKAKTSTVPAGAWPDDIGRARALTTLAEIDSRGGDYTRAIERLQESLALHQKLNLGSLYVANDFASLGRVYTTMGDYAKALFYLNKALEYFKQSAEAAKATHLVEVQIAAGEGIGVVLTAQQKFADALRVLNESLGAAKRSVSKTREIELEWRIAQTLFETQKFGEAAGHAEAAIGLAQSAHLPKLEYLATTTLGQVYSAQGKLELAKETLIRATHQLERLRQQVAGRETASQLYFENKLASYHSLVDILVRQDEPVEALL